MTALTPRSHKPFTLFALLVVLGVVLGPLSASGNDPDFFRPTLEPTPTKRPQGPPPVFSFSRFEPDLRVMCSGMEEEGRRERFVSIAENVLEGDKTCISCKSIWRAVLSACGKLGPKPTPKSKPIRKKGDGEKTLESETGAQDGASETPPTAAPSEKAVEPARPLGTRVRTPSTELLDKVSQFGTKLYEEDPGDGAVASTFRYMVTTVTGFKELSDSEREYFDTLFSYLLAPWEGRIDPIYLPTPTPPAKLHEFFDE